MLVIGARETLFLLASCQHGTCSVLSQDNDLLDKRKHCFSVQTESGEDMFFSVELECELLIWEKAFQMATFLEVERIQVSSFTAGEQTWGFSFGCCCAVVLLMLMWYLWRICISISPLCVIFSSDVLQCKTYACIMESHLMGLTIDFSMGFVCFDAASKVSARQPFVVIATRKYNLFSTLGVWAHLFDGWLSLYSPS